MTQVSPQLADKLIAWQKTAGRHDLPWHNTHDPYAVWVSEIMLQQTQGSAVIPYYHRFMARFPTVQALAAAPADDVLAHWSGLGYYARARNLHRAAQRVVEVFDGRFPDQFDDILSLPGIGRSTAAAIAAFCFGQKRAILDGNVKRVLARVFAVDAPIDAAQTANRLLETAEAILPDHEIGVYTQGLMDLGATVCTRTRPRCTVCPWQAECMTYRTGRTGDLPAKKVRPEKPHREAYFPMLVCDARILLVRRPARGIWGGLWSLPQFETRTELDAWLAGNRLRVEPVEREPLLHVFTHFRLTLHPLRIDIAPGKGLRQAPDGGWYTVADALALGLPAPIRRLIMTIAEER
jgi:A/G-specific adenine glycosylase